MRPGPRHVLALALALGVLGCDDEAPEELSSVEIPSPPPRPEAEPGEPEEPVMVRRSRPIMGTVFQVTVLGMPEEQAGPLIDRSLDEMERLENVLSEWRDDTEIAQINTSAGEDEPISIGTDTVAVLRAALEVARWSDGAFDPTWAALRGLYTFQPDDHEVPALADVRRRLRLVSYEDLEFDPEASTARLTREGMALGTGGIGKGYALDRAGAVLREGGAESYMLFGGGQVQVHGMRGDRPWRVGIQHPRDPATYIGFLESTDGSISTSGDYEHAFRDDEGTHWHHIIDLSTGLPARRSMQVTLLADEGVYADALSTACFVIGPQGCLEMISEIPGHQEAVIIDSDLRVHTTEGTEDRIVWRVERDEGRLPGDTEFRGWQRIADPRGVEMPSGD